MSDRTCADHGLWKGGSAVNTWPGLTPGSSDVPVHPARPLNCESARWHGAVHLSVNLSCRAVRHHTFAGLYVPRTLRPPPTEPYDLSCNYVPGGPPMSCHGSGLGGIHPHVCESMPQQIVGIPLTLGSRGMAIPVDLAQTLEFLIERPAIGPFRPLRWSI